MKKMASLFMMAALVLGLSACGGGGNSEGSAPPSNNGGNTGSGTASTNDGNTNANTATSGAREIFEQSCARCHGKNLEGGIGPALDHIGKTMTEEQIRQQIKTGGGTMPPNVIEGEKADTVAKWLAAKK